MKIPVGLKVVILRSLFMRILALQLTYYYSGDSKGKMKNGQMNRDKHLWTLVVEMVCSDWLKNDSDW